MFYNFLNSTARLLGKTDVIEKDGMITIYNIPRLQNALLRFSQEVLRSRKIYNTMFEQSGFNNITFPSFFLIEFVYILERMLVDTKKTTYIQQRHIKKIFELLEKNTWYKTLLEEPVSITNTMFLQGLKWKALPNQLAYIEQYGLKTQRLELRGLLLPAPPGTGKTFTTLALAECLPKALTEVKLIIVPKKTLNQVWVSTIKEIYNRPIKLWVSDTNVPLELGYEFYVVHYEALPKILPLIKTMASKNIKYFTIIDECHNFNEIKSNRTQSLIEICNLQKDTYSVWSSGTPLKALGAEIIPFLKSVDNFFTPYVEKCFKRIYNGTVSDELLVCLSNRLDKIMYKIPKIEVVKIEPIIKTIGVKLKNGNEYTSPKIREDIQEFISERYAFYSPQINTLNDEFFQLIKKYERVLSSRYAIDYKNYISMVTSLKNAKKIRLSRELMIKYLQETKLFETKVLIPSMDRNDSKRFKEIRSVVKALPLKILGEAIGTVIVKARMKLTGELMENCGINDIISNSLAKTLVFSTYVDVIRKTEDYVSGFGYTPVCIFKDTARDTDKLLDQFKVVEELNPIIATYASLSTGVPVITANTIVMLDVPTRQYLYDQAVARVCRLGQTKQVYVYEIILDTGNVPNISQRMKDILEWSRNQVGLMMGEDMSTDDVENTLISVENEIATKSLNYSDK